MLRPKLTVGGSVATDGRIYITRQTDDDLYYLLRDGEYCNLLSSRMTGKSSAILRVKNRLEREGFKTATVELAGSIGGQVSSPDKWYHGLYHLISKQLDLSHHVNLWWESYSDLPSNMKLLAFFREIVLGSNSNRTVIFLDEIDITLAMPYTDDFFLGIRSLYNDRAGDPDLRRLAFCLVGVFKPNELIKSVRTTSYNVGRTVELKDFDRKNDNLEDLQKALSCDPAKSVKILSRILDWTGGHPYLTMSACNKVLNSKVDSPDSVDELIIRSFVQNNNTHYDNDDEHFEGIQKYIEIDYERCLAIINFYRRILGGESISDSKSANIHYLKLSGLVKSVKSILVVRNKIYRLRFNEEWCSSTIKGISMGMPLDSTDKSKDRWDEGTDITDKGNETIGADENDDRNSFSPLGEDQFKHELEKDLRACREISEVCKVAVSHAKTRLRCQAAFIYLLDKDGYITRNAINGIDHEGHVIQDNWLYDSSKARAEHYRPNEGLTGRGITITGQAEGYGFTQHSDRFEHEYFVQSKYKYGKEYANKLGSLLSGMSVKIAGSSRPYGAIDVINKKDINLDLIRFTKDDYYHLDNLSRLVAVHISRIRSMARESTMDILINGLYSVSSSRPTSLYSICQKLANSLVSEPFPFKVCILREYNDTNKFYNLAKASLAKAKGKGISWEGRTQGQPELDPPHITRLVVDRQKCVYVEDLIASIKAERYRFHNLDWIERNSLAALSIHPLIFRNAVLGTISIYLGYKYEFSDEDRVFLSNISRLLACVVFAHRQKNFE
jgi:hypothetical protein